MKGKVGGQRNKIFMEIIKSMLHGFLPLSLVSLTELCSFWYGVNSHNLHVSLESVWIMLGDNY